MDISVYIVDRLTVRTGRTGLAWYLPTAEDQLAESKAAFALNDWVRGDGGADWGTDDEERFGA